MRKLLLSLLLLLVLAPPVSASEITAPQVPQSGSALMPEKTETFSDGLRFIIREALTRFRPDLKEAAETCLAVCGAALFVSVAHNFPGSTRQSVQLAGTVLIGFFLLKSTNSLINLGTDTIQELSQYGKLLLPVMTSALAAQGAPSTSAALYAATAAFNAVLTALLVRLLIPMVYIYLALSTANSALGEDVLKKMRDFVKWLMTWCIKIILSIFTLYISVTGVVSGTTDAAALKVTKITISGMVPVVGGILSDASEAVLVGAGIAKNAAGIYGILAIAAVFLGPFLRIGVHYLMLRASGAACAIFSPGTVSELIQDFGTAMGLLLAMAGSICLLLMISTVCFLRGVG